MNDGLVTIIYLNYVSVLVAKQNTPFVAFARMPSIQLTGADLEGGVRGVRPPKIRKAYVIQR